MTPPISTCGACVTVGAKVTAAGDVGAYYSARSGVLNLTSVSGRITGTLQNVMLYRVLTDADGNPSDMATFDCESRIASASFDTELLPPEPISTTSRGQDRRPTARAARRR